MPEAPWRLQLAPFTERARKASQGAAHPPVSQQRYPGVGERSGHRSQRPRQDPASVIEQYQAAARRP